MVIFHSYVSLPEGNILILSYLHGFDHGFDQDANPRVVFFDRTKTEKLRKERSGQVIIVQSISTTQNHFDISVNHHIS